MPVLLQSHSCSELQSQGERRAYQGFAWLRELEHANVDAETQLKPLSSQLRGSSCVLIAATCCRRRKAVLTLLVGLLRRVARSSFPTGLWVSRRHATRPRALVVLTPN